MNKIFWIDDDISDMKRIIINLFPELWSRNYNSQIIFVGNNYREVDDLLSRDQASLVDLHNTTSSIFEIFCADQIDKNNENLNTPKKVREYKNKMGMQLFKPEEIKIDENSNIDDIIKDVMNKINDGLFIGIDIRLFMTDKNYISENKETLAMKLYYLLSNDEKINRTVFLYTSFYTPNIQEKWGEKFKEYHPDYNKNIEIYSRNNIINPENDKDEEQKKLLSLLEKKVI